MNIMMRMQMNIMMGMKVVLMMKMQMKINCEDEDNVEDD